jgi:hypothetical protein
LTAGKPPVESDWEGARFLASALAWIDDALDGLGLARNGEIDQPHVRPRSTVLRVPTSGGDVWFKAAVPALGHDVGVTTILSRLRPELVLAPLAVDAERTWMLLPDGGRRLREVLARERRPRRWLDLAPRYSELQLAAVPAVEELLEAGAPDYRLELLPRLSAGLAATLGLPPPPRGRLAELCEELAAGGLPETIQHDDLHDGNVFLRPTGGYAVFDWGDSCVTHPFASLAVLLDGIANTFGLAPCDRDLERIRDAYLEPWGAPRDLVRAVAIARSLGRLTRALAWRRAGLGPGASSEGATANYEQFSRGVRELAR